MKKCRFAGETSKTNNSAFNSNSYLLKQEAAIYVRNLVTEYGSFNFAEPNTKLNVQMYERHLFEMIPCAWKKLGKTCVPLSLSKPIPARRKSVPAHKIAESQFPPPISGSGRIITRRASTINDNKQSNPMANVINYRQSIRLNELELQKKSSIEDTLRAPIPKFIIRLNGAFTKI